MRKTVPPSPGEPVVAAFSDVDEITCTSAAADAASQGGAARPPAAFGRQLADYLRALADIGFEQWLTPRMAPALYALGVLGSLYGVAMFVIDGFARSNAVGVGRLLFIGPVAFLVAVTLIRVLLEICLVLFRIAVQMNQMAGHTEEIAGGMPRITFWKSWWRREPPKS